MTENLLKNIYRNSARTSQETLYNSATKISQFRKQSKHKNTLSGQNSEFSYITVAGTYRTFGFYWFNNG
jgi:hypothetical protein